MFIEITAQGGRKLHINLDHILLFRPNDDTGMGGTRFVWEDDTVITAEEDYQTVVNKLKETSHEG